MLSAGVSVVTGAGGGIGGATALLLAKKGLAVVLVGRQAQGLENCAQKISESVNSARCAVVMGDVGDEAAWSRIFAEAQRRFGGVDVLVNAAGDLKLSELAETSLEDFEQTLAGNLRGSFL